MYTPKEMRSLNSDLRNLARDQGFYNLAQLLDSLVKKLPITSKPLQITPSLYKVTKGEHQKILKDKSSYKYINKVTLDQLIQGQREKSLAAHIAKKCREEMYESPHDTDRHYRSTSSSSDYSHTNIKNQLVALSKVTQSQARFQKGSKPNHKFTSFKSEYYQKSKPQPKKQSKYEGIDKIMKNNLTTQQLISLKRKEYLNTTLFLQKKLFQSIQKQIDQLKDRIGTIKISQTCSKKPLKNLFLNEEAQIKEDIENEKDSQQALSMKSMSIGSFDAEQILCNKQALEGAWRNSRKNFQSIFTSNQQTLNNQWKMPSFQAYNFNKKDLKTKRTIKSMKTLCKYTTRQPSILNFPMLQHKKSEKQEQVQESPLDPRLAIQSLDESLDVRGKKSHIVKIFPHNTKFVQRASLSLLRQV